MSGKRTTGTKRAAVAKKAKTRQRRSEWWRNHEQVAAVFETLYQPLEARVMHDVRERDVVGVSRQLDVGVIDDSTGERRVRALVEVQKRKSKVGMGDFGSWVYKRDTLKAAELVVVSEKGFAASVLKHIKAPHHDTVRLGTLHETEAGLVERFNSTILGIVRVNDAFWFASILVQFADADEIKPVKLQGLDTEAKIFGPTSPMGIIRYFEAHVGVQRTGSMETLVCDTTQAGFSYEGRPLKRIIIVSEKHRRIWEPVTRFYTYDEVHPNPDQRGIAIISTFRVDEARTGKLTLVISPDPEKVTGNYARIAGQFEFVGPDNNLSHSAN
jgi:hypothetical protein